MSASTSPSASAPRPDPASRLLAAVAERDAALAQRLGQRWVHRRGLLSLDQFLQQHLAASQGEDAVAWLCMLLDLGRPVASAVGPAPEPELASEPVSEVELSPRRPGRLSLGRVTALVRQCFGEAAESTAPTSEPDVPTPPEPWAAESTPLAAVSSPAPAPASLANLRAWLPDAG